MLRDPRPRRPEKRPRRSPSAPKTSMRSSGASVERKVRSSATQPVSGARMAQEALAPHVITNGRNLWVHWRRIDKDALVVVVDVKLPYPGGSTAYYDAVGRCNVLIAKAIQDAGAELCLPTSRRVDIKK